MSFTRIPIQQPTITWHEHIDARLAVLVGRRRLATAGEVAFDPFALSEQIDGLLDMRNEHAPGDVFLGGL